MNPSRLLSRALAVLTAAATVLALPATTETAQAAPATCTTTYSTPGMRAVPPVYAPAGYSVDFVDIEVPDQRVVLDVDYGFEVSVSPDAAGLAFSLDNPQSANNAPRSTAEGATGPIAGVFVIDDEASSPFAAVSPPSGRYRPRRAAAELDGGVAAGRWRFFVTNTSEHTGSWGNVTLTLTLDCDADKDGVADAGDNCLTSANPDQANMDGDSVGDACDLDTDGDALADTVDGCPGTAAATTSGCPSVGRKAALHFRKKKRRLTFVVRSDAPGCRAGAEASLWRVKRGKDTRLLVAETDASGRYRAKAPRRAGRYYLRIASSYAAGQAECGAARSNTERVR